MSEEKPLHVRVAEALGCKPKQSWGLDWDCTCKAQPTKARPYSDDRPHSNHLVHAAQCHDGEGLGCDNSELARYDTDWSATGPLIEKLGLRLWPHPVERWIAEWQGEVIGDGEFAGQYEMQAADGGTPLEAVCNLILALKEAGKL